MSYTAEWLTRKQRQRNSKAETRIRCAFVLRSHDLKDGYRSCQRQAMQKRLAPRHLTKNCDVSAAPRPQAPLDNPPLPPFLEGGVRIPDLMHRPRQGCRLYIPLMPLQTAVQNPPPL